MSPKTSPPCEASDLALRSLLSEILDACKKDRKKDRKQIAAELSEKLGRTITVAFLDSYTCRTKTTARFPAAYVRAFCEVTGNDKLLRLLFTPTIESLVKLGECEVAAHSGLISKTKLLGGLVKVELDRGADAQ